ncbi:MAG: hypothetical protein CMA60_00340 [Euryarchaeota archaeon]|nr:hypothetical protein [Euryarchaeota archaeon]|tara:strand:+ start:14209 stop:14439 length:231 start_codon:yes stop_codon:yes gene_type:complete
MSITKNEQTPRSVGILALGDTMMFFAAVWFGFWIGTSLRHGEFDDWWIYWSLGSYVFGYTMNHLGNIMEKLENAGF